MALGTVIKSFSSPAAEPRGLYYNGRTLWHADGAADTIYQIALDGTVLKSFSGPSTASLSVIQVGGFVWHGDSNTDLIYLLDIDDGTVIRSFSRSDPLDLAWDGRYLYAILFSSGRIDAIDPIDGTIARSITTGQSNCRGIELAGDGGFWITAGANIKWIAPDGTEILSVSSPSTTPNGLAFDGHTLWHCDFNSDLIYQLSIE